MSRRSASPAEDAIHDLLQTMSQKERDARYDAGADDGAAAVRAAREAQHTLRRAAFVATLVQDNLFHSLFHAVPTREHAARVLVEPTRVRCRCALCGGELLRAGSHATCACLSAFPFGLACLCKSEL